MTREQAQEQAARYNREHPERTTHRWLARAAGDGWEVARVTLPPGMGAQPMGSITEAKPKPPQASDPRPNYFRDSGGPWVA